MVSDVAGQITALRFWKSPGETGAHVGRVWSNAGQSLASVAFTNETASGWQQQALSTPLAVAASTAYVVSVNTGTNGYYAATGNAFTTPLVHAHLTAPAGANGLYGSPGTFPPRPIRAPIISATSSSSPAAALPTRRRPRSPSRNLAMAPSSAAPDDRRHGPRRRRRRRRAVPGGWQHRRRGGPHRAVHRELGLLYRRQWIATAQRRRARCRQAFDRGVGHRHGQQRRPAAADTLLTTQCYPAAQGFTPGPTLGARAARGERCCRRITRPAVHRSPGSPKPARM